MLDLLETQQQKPPHRRDYLSFSAIRTYQGCPLRYAFRYVEGLPETFVAASLLFGAGIHAALEAHYRALLAGDEVLGMDELLGAFWGSWEARQAPEIRFAKGEDLSIVGRLAERLIKAFMASNLASPKGTIIGVEEELRGPLVEGLPDLLGRVDLIVEEPDALVITDFKTARTSWNEDQVEGAADQLLLYHELVRPLADDKPVRLEFMVLTKTKSPSVARHLVAYNPRQVERTKRIVENVWHAMECEHFYPIPSCQCASCPFRSPCGKWQG